MTISAIGGNNDWMKKKLLERQAQRGMQSQEQGQNLQQMQGQQEVKDVDKADKASGQVGAQQGQLPWADLMSQLGIKPQGSQQADMSAIGTAIESQKAGATSEADKLQLESLEKDYQNMQAMAGSMQPMQQPKTEELAGGPTAGQEQLAELNKLLLLKGKLV